MCDHVFYSEKMGFEMKDNQVLEQLNLRKINSTSFGKYSSNGHGSL